MMYSQKSFCYFMVHTSIDIDILELLCYNFKIILILKTMTEAVKKSPDMPETELIKPLRLRQVTTTRGKIIRLLKNIGILTGIGIAGGAFGGLSAREAFRDITKYDPDWKEKLESGEISLIDNENEESSENPEEETPEEVQEETNGILAKIGGVLGQAKDMSAEMIENLINKAMDQITEKYRGAEKKMLEKYYEAMEKVDDKVLWGSFWASFAITIILALGAIKLKKMALGEGNPELAALERNMLKIQRKINEMIRIQQEMLKMQFILPEEQLELLEGAREIMSEYEAQKEQIDTKIGD